MQTYTPETALQQLKIMRPTNTCTYMHRNFIATSQNINI